MEFYCDFCDAEVELYGTEYPDRCPECFQWQIEDTEEEVLVDAG